MCGIYGYIGTPKNANTVYDIIQTMAIRTESRGIDSTGFASLSDSTLYHDKKLLPANKFYDAVNVKSVIGDSYFFVGHNRMASCGNVSLENAHPFIGKKLAFVHNGTVYNARKTLNKLDLKTSGKTDSEAIMVLVEKYGPGVLKRLSGLSVVMIDYNDKGSIMFYRDHCNPMWTCDIRDVAGVILFASTKYILESGLKKLTATNYKTFLDRAKKTPIGQLLSYNKNGKCHIVKTKTDQTFASTINKIILEKIVSLRRKEITYAGKNYWGSEPILFGRQFEGYSVPNDDSGFYNLHED